MADNVRIQGFRPVKSLTGRPPLNPVRMLVASAYQATNGGAVAVDLCVGDPVLRVNDGTVAQATAGASVWGVIVGIAQYWNGSVMTFGPSLPGATTWGTVIERASYVYVIPAPGTVFEVDCDDSSTATTQSAYQALVGENCDHIFTAGTNPKSGCQLDISDHKTTTAQWNIIGISDTAANQDFSGLYVKLHVVINETLVNPWITTGI